jgi:hypothetical protein
LRNGQLIATVAAPYYRDTTASSQGNDVYSIVALDMAGNASAPSQTAISGPLANLAPRVIYHYYANVWSQMPDFTQLTPDKVGAVAGFDLSVRQRNESYTLEFIGELEVPASGAWTFTLNSDDGSMLWIDGNLVVNNDGLNGAQTHSGSVTLGAGVHAITVGYLQNTTNQSLSVLWEGPGTARQTIPNDFLFHGPDTQAPTAPQNVTAIGLASCVQLA